MSKAEPMVLVDAAVRTPPDRDFWTTEAMYDPDMLRPSWNTAVMGMTFFAISRDSVHRWIRLGYNACEFTGEVLPPRRSGGPERYIWRLWDIERFAHAAAAHSMITGGKLSRAILLVKTCAEVHGYL